jgi:SAM-dependent methyltransferase
MQFLKRQRALHSLGLFSLGGGLAARQFGVPEYYEWLRRGHVRLEHSILDVGSGTGRLLHALQREGFTHLTGIEPQVETDIEYPNGVRVLKKPLEDLEAGFDLLLFHHSFEHLADPLEALRQAHRLLNPDRYAVLRIPVAGSYAWRQYGVNWVQLDAPRHLYLHTRKSIQILADQSGFRIEEVIYDSTEFQFWGSEAYQQGKTLASLDGVPATEEELAKYRHRAEELNRRGEGDQASFYLFRH